MVSRVDAFFAGYVSANLEGFYRFERHLSDYIEKFEYQPEIFSDVLHTVRSTCEICQHLGKGHWKIIPSILTASPGKSNIRIETDSKCARGEKIQLDAEEFVKNPLCPKGRCPRNQIIPAVMVREGCIERGERYIEEVGGCGRVKIEGNLLIRRRTVNYDTNPPEYDVYLPLFKLPKPSFFTSVEGSTFPELLKTYEEFGWLSPEDHKIISENLDI